MSCKCNLFTQEALVNQTHLIIKATRKKLAGFYKLVFFSIGWTIEPGFSENQERDVCFTDSILHNAFVTVNWK